MNLHPVMLTVNNNAGILKMTDISLILNGQLTVSDHMNQTVSVNAVLGQTKPPDNIFLEGTFLFFHPAVPHTTFISVYENKKSARTNQQTKNR